MKKIIYIALAAAALAAVSCSKNAEFANEPVKPGLTLTFFSGEMATRATVDGVNNENRVDKIDYFIFPMTEGVAEDGTTPVLTVADDAVPVYSNTISVGAEDRLKKTYVEVIEPNKLAKIFPNETKKAMVFAVANYNGKTELSDEMTWKTLHGLEVGATFTKDGGTGFGLRWPRAMKTDDASLFFVMVGEAEIELKVEGGFASKAEVPLNRLASKVTAEFTYSDFLETKKNQKTGEVTAIINWVPQNEADEARVYLSNAICTTTLGGPLSRTLNPDGGTETAPSPNRDIFEYGYDYLKQLVDAGQVPYYYTYPFEFQKEGDDNQPYLKLVLPWYGYKYVGTETNPTYSAGSPDWVFYKEKEVYYKIVLPRETVTEPNRIYEFKVAVNIIGSDKEVKLIGEEYMVKDWSTKDPVSANVATGRFISLDIPKDDYDMYVEEISIAFVSSGEVEISNLQIYQDDFSEPTATTDDYFDGKPWAASGYKNGRNANTVDIMGTKITDWVKIDGTKLKILHHMNNDYSDADFDAAPFHFIANLHLVDAENDFFDREIHITQYPAICVQPEQSNSFAYVDGHTSSQNDDYSYVWDDTYTDGGVTRPGTNVDGDSFLGVVVNRSFNNSSNANKNQYSVTITILDPEKSTVSVGSESEPMIIGDPRGAATSLSNMSALGSGYRPASDNSQAVIAPKLRIASSYGASSRFTYEGAKKRCAAYQENGYPAGRWRLPTLAEIQFLITLSENGKIPPLFSPTSRTYNTGGWNSETQTHYLGYWSSGGWLYYGGSEDVKSVNLSGQTATWRAAHYEQNSGYDYGYNINRNYYFGATRCVYDEWYWGSEKVSIEDKWIPYMTSETN